MNFGLDKRHVHYLALAERIAPALMFDIISEINLIFASTDAPDLQITAAKASLASERRTQSASLGGNFALRPRLTASPPARSTNFLADPNRKLGDTA